MKNPIYVGSAKGMDGQLIYNHGIGTFMFRVYSDNHDKFIDYDIMHCDLSITITDADAAFYCNKNEKGEVLQDFLDHSPSTLGIKLP